MLTKVLKKRDSNRIAPGGSCPHPKSINLYRFIRLILGTDTSDAAIAQMWNMDPKNFYEFKSGKYPVPRLERLEQLALVLGINKHLVFEVAGGAPADKVFKLIRKKDLPACRALLGVGRPGQRSDSGVPPQRG